MSFLLKSKFYKFSLPYWPISSSNNNPYCTYILRVRYYFDSYCMSNLITALDHNNIFANFVTKNVMDDSICVKMSKLYWKSFKCVTFGYIVFNTCLEFVICKCLSTNSFEFVVTESSLKQIWKLTVPSCWKVSSIVLPNSSNFISQ